MIGQWSNLNQNSSNLIIKGNYLRINSLKKENFGLYKCKNDKKSTIINYLIKENKNKKLVARIKSVDLNSSIKLNFLTPIENINEESSVKIKCSSLNSTYIYYKIKF